MRASGATKYLAQILKLLALAYALGGEEKSRAVLFALRFEDNIVQEVMIIFRYYSQVERAIVKAALMDFMNSHGKRKRRALFDVVDLLWDVHPYLKNEFISFFESCKNNMPIFDTLDDLEVANLKSSYKFNIFKVYNELKVLLRSFPPHLRKNSLIPLMVKVTEEESERYATSVLNTIDSELMNSKEIEEH